MGNVAHQLRHLGKLGGFHQTCMLNRDSGECRDNGENSQVVPVEDFPPALVHDLNDTDRVAPPTFEGNRDHVMSNGAGRLIDFLKVAVIGLCVRDDFRHARPIYRSGNTLVPGHRCTRCYRFLTNRVIKHEGALVGVGQQHGPVFRIRNIECDVKPLFQQILESGLLREDLQHSLSSRKLQFSSGKKLRRELLAILVGAIDGMRCRRVVETSCRSIFQTRSRHSGLIIFLSGSPSNPLN